jgi:hypothetical protein
MSFYFVVSTSLTSTLKGKSEKPELLIRIRIHRIPMFLGLLDPGPDPLVRGMDPDPDPAPDLDSDPSIIMPKIVRNLDSYYFDYFLTFYHWKLM